LSGENSKVAVVGLGKMGLMHAGIISVLPNAKLVAACEKSAIIRKFLKKVLGAVTVVDDISKLSGLSLDAVYVTTPIMSHFPVIKSLFSEKIASNIFVEKTLASSSSEAKELCELDRRFGGVTMVGYQRHFSVTFRKAKKLLEQEAIGKLISFEAYAYSSDFFGSEDDSKAHAAKVGALRDLGCHIIDAALWFFGDMQVESAKFGTLSGSRSQTIVYFECKRSDGLDGKFSVSQSMENYRMPEVGLLVSGSLGTIEVNDDRLDLKLKSGRSRTWYRHDLNDNVAFLLGTPEYFREDAHFINSILQGQTAEPSFETAMKVDCLIDQIKEKADKIEQ
jgi:predicted dehydrogenase